MSLLRLKNQLLAKVFTAFPRLASRWGEQLEADPEAIPWTAVRKPLREAVVAVVTTGGVHLLAQKPFDMADEEGDPSYREIPADAPRELLTITHDYYNHKDADQDLNLVLPLERLRELVEARALGGLHTRAYSFMGHIDGEHLRTLVNRTAREMARKLASTLVDYALLVPA
jgi:D-proline reductase (dithiol) PrdB